MAEFFEGMSPKEYDKLTRRQRSWIIAGTVAAVIIQSVACCGIGFLLHQLPH